MKDDFRALAVFVAVADHGGFSGAGKKLGLSPSVVSHHVGRLEEMLGISLFYRSTRSISLTQDGQRMLEPARRMVAARNEAIESISDGGAELVGTLKLSAPSFGYTTELHKRMLAFIRDHPRLDVQLHHADSQVDIIRDGFDVAIRLGTLSDSGLKSKKIGEFRRLLVASPDYVAKRPAIRNPNDLQHCEIITFAMIPSGFTLTKGRIRRDIAPGRTRLQANSIESVRAAIKAGIGIQRLPDFEVEDDIERGELVRLLPDWELPTQGVFAVWPNTASPRSVTRAFIDYMAER